MSFITDNIETFGYAGVWAIIFSESGILFGILLPGDFLLFSAGVLAAQGTFGIVPMAIGCAVAAFLGNIVGYETGRQLGLPFVQKHASTIITKGHLSKTRAFFRKYGRAALIIGRFIAFVRTLAPFLAGMSRMRYPAFLLYSAIGAVIWGGGLPLAGYKLAELVPPEFVDYLLIPLGISVLAAFLGPFVKKKLAALRNKDDHS